MLAYPEMLIEPAKKAGMLTPEIDHIKDIDTFKETHPHFWFFCICQLGSPMPYAGCHWDNAHIIASLTYEQMKTITFDQLIENGFAYGYSK